MKTFIKSEVKHIDNRTLTNIESGCKYYRKAYYSKILIYYPIKKHKNT